MKFWEYLAERQKQKTVRRLADVEARRVEKIMADHVPAVAIPLLEKTEGTMQKYLDRVLPRDKS